jgi:RHS repeat-associated protein
VLNRLVTLAFNGQTPVFGLSYDSLSRRTTLNRPNGVNTTYGYDPASNLLSVLHKLGTTTLDGATYTYDPANNRKTRTDKRTNVALTYAYDNIYQLLSAKQGTTTKETYTYDPVGNRLSSLGVSPYVNNPSNELTSTPSASYTYDNNGNTLTKSGGTTYGWDFENRMISAVVPGVGTVTFKYDPFGRRIQKSGPSGTVNYLYDGKERGANVIEEVDNAGNVLARYTQNARYRTVQPIDEPLAMQRAGATSYYQQDALESVTSLSNSSGVLANTYTYDSFGKTTASTGTLTNPFQYTGRDYDPEIGVRYYRARYYDENIGRFLNEDPIQFGAGTNFFAYVANNPINRIDPSGLSPAGMKCPCAIEAGLIRGIACVYGCACPDGSSRITIVKCRLTDPYANKVCPLTYSITVRAGSVVDPDKPAPGFCGPIPCQ